VPAGGDFQAALNIAAPGDVIALEAGATFTVRNQDGTAPWSPVEDVTFSNNIVRHTGSAVGMHGWDDLYPSQLTRRILIRNNLFDDVSGGRWGGFGRLFGANKGIEDLVIDHNTGFQDGAILRVEGGCRPDGGGPCHTRFVFRNNLALHNEHGIHGAGTAPGHQTLAAYFPGALVERNVMVGNSHPLQYPPNNFYPSSLDSVGFLNLAGRDYRLARSSPYKRAATDGRDIGVDFEALSTVLARPEGKKRRRR